MRMHRLLLPGFQRHLLWHFTHRQNADAIARDGFRLSRGAVRWMHRDRAIYFYHSVPAFLGRGGIAGLTDAPSMDAFLCAIDLEDYERGLHYVHEAVCGQGAGQNWHAGCACAGQPGSA